LDAHLRDTNVPQRVLRVVLAVILVFIKHLQRLGWNPGESSPTYSGPVRGKAQQGNLLDHLFRVERDSGRHPRTRFVLHSPACPQQEKSSWYASPQGFRRRAVKRATRS
jgi:hypothetical protein